MISFGMLTSDIPLNFVIVGLNGADTYLHDRAEAKRNHIPIKQFDGHIF